MNLLLPAGCFLLMLKSRHVALSVPSGCASQAAQGLAGAISTLRVYLCDCEGTCLNWPEKCFPALVAGRGKQYRISCTIVCKKRIWVSTSLAPSNYSRTETYFRATGK